MGRPKKPVIPLPNVFETPLPRKSIVLVRGRTDLSYTTSTERITLGQAVQLAFSMGGYNLALEKIVKIISYKGNQGNTFTFERI